MIRILYQIRPTRTVSRLTPVRKEVAELPHWWHDKDHADELDRAIWNGGFLPTVTETVGLR